MEHKSEAEKKEIDVLWVTSGGNSEDKGKSFAAISGGNHSSDFTYDSIEDGASSSAISPKTTSPASKKRKKAKWARAKRAQRGIKSLEKQRNPDRSISRSGYGPESSDSKSNAPSVSDMDTKSQCECEKNQDRGSKRSSKKNQELPKFKRFDRVWDSSQQKFRMEEIELRLDDIGQKDGCIFVVRRDFDYGGKHIGTFVKITDSLFKECLQEIMGNITGVNFTEENPTLDPKILLLYLDDFRRHHKLLVQAKPHIKTNHWLEEKWKILSAKREYLRVLISYLEYNFVHIEKDLKMMLDNGVITFDLLWTLWKPSTLIYSPTYLHHHVPAISMVTFSERRKRILPESDEYSVEVKVVDFDGKSLAYKTLRRELRYFTGAVKINSLPFYPLRYHKDEAQICSLLIERGAKFVSLQGVHHKLFTGMAFSLSCDRNPTTAKVNVEQTRIMIDPVAFRKVNPNYFETTDMAIQYTANDEETFNNGVQPRNLANMLSTKKVQEGLRNIEDGAQGSEDPFDLDAYPFGESEEKARLKKAARLEKAKNNLLLLCCPVIVGYSLAHLDWLEFDVRGIEDIRWNDETWGSLVLEHKTKELIQASVASHISYATHTLDDVVPTKGKGLTIVLHGPPGTGKTLTVAGLGEHLRRPLVMISARELEPNTAKIDIMLRKLLATCSSWGAIVLIDEADMLLEKYDKTDRERNSMLAVILRRLESFHGIVFLTSNSVRSFHEAYQSRIDLALRYDKLDRRGKRVIFKRVIDRARALGRQEIETFSDEDWDKLVESDFNGREIKKLVTIALGLAEARKEALGVGHLQQVMDMHERFRRDSQGLDQRSYFS
ncbi:P-loop containing nucleoside triphosphate hydrolase protein [Trichoderma ceciliae]